MSAAVDVSYEERKRMVAALTRAGWSAARIAPVVGVHPGTIWRIRQAAGVAGAPSRPFTEDEERRARELFAEGESIYTVAQIIGRDSCVLGRHFPDAPRVDPRESGRRGALVQQGERMMRRLGLAA